MALENIIKTNTKFKKIGKTLVALATFGAITFGNFNKIETPSTNPATQYIQSLGISTAYAEKMGKLEKQGYHPLYDILLKNAKDKDLKKAIINLAHENYETAAFILLPEYNNFGRYITIISTKMSRNKVGGNNPAYWIALKLAVEGVNDSRIYNAIFIRSDNPISRDPPLPTDKKIFKFAKNLTPTSSNWVEFKSTEKKRKRHDDFFKEIKSSKIF